MIRILCIGLECADAASYYRICPFFHLEKALHLEIKIQVSASFVDVMNSDVVYLNRGFNEDHLRIAKLTKSLGKKLWSDFDDDVLAIQQDHSAYFIYQNPQTSERIQKIQEISDIVSVSNEPLLKIYPGSILIENALDERYFEWRTPSAKPIHQIVSWRGSSSHVKTLSQFSKPLARVMDNHLDWKFHFAGEKPWQVMENVKKATPFLLGEWLDSVSFTRYLHDLKPTINIVLLADTPFNRGRSHTSWLENTMAGAVTLAPDWPHWHLPNVVNYKNVKDFKFQLELLITRFMDGQDFYSQVEKAWDFILQNYTLKQINLKRATILENLFAQGDQVCASPLLKIM